MKISTIIWRDINEEQPPPFVSVMCHMTDSGEFPSIREGFHVGSGIMMFPALCEAHPIDAWAYFPDDSEFCGCFKPTKLN